MNNKLKWLEHSVGSLIGTGSALTLIYAFVPARYQTAAIAVCLAAGYMLGVRMPVPGMRQVPKALAPLKATQAQPWDALKGK